MSQSPRANVVCTFIDRTDKKDLDSAHQLVTDDFLYQIEPKPIAELGLNYTDGGLNKAKQKEFGAKISSKFNNYKVSLSALHFKLRLTVANL